MKKTLLRLRMHLADDSGAVTVIVAILLVVLLGLAALVIDAGGLYDRDRELQTAADAGALAGVAGLFYDRSTTAAETAADEYIDRNAAVSSVVVENLTQRDVEVGPTWVQVDLREDDIPFFFARALEHDTGSVIAHARAEIKPLAQVGDLFPVLSQYYVDRLVLKLQNGGQTLSFPLGKGATSGGYTTWSATFNATMDTGYWDATLESVHANDNANDNAYARYIGIGRLNVVADASAPYVYSLDRTGDAVAVVVAAADQPDLGVSVGGGGNIPASDTGATTTEGLKLWQFNLANNRVVFCGSTRDYEVQSLSLKVGSGSEAVNFPDAARFPDFHRDADGYDVPIISFSMPPSVQPGGAVTVQARVREFQFGEYFPLKIDSNIILHGGGSRRTANVYRDRGLAEEVAGPFAPSAGQWTPFYPPLAVGNKLDTASEQVMGGSGGVIKNGWGVREDGARALGWDGAYLTPAQILASPNDSPEIGQFDPGYIIVPIVYWRNDHGEENITYYSGLLGRSVSLTRDDYRIHTFAGYYVTDPPSASASAIGGYFIRSLGHGQWDPNYNPGPGDLYVETVVLTE